MVVWKVLNMSVTRITECIKSFKKIEKLKVNFYIRRHFQKSIILLAITLQVVLCRPDVSHLSGSLGAVKGYAYPKPEGPFEEDGRASIGEDPSETSGGSFSANENFVGSHVEENFEGPDQ